MRRICGRLRRRVASEDQIYGSPFAPPLKVVVQRFMKAPHAGFLRRKSRIAITA